MPASSTWQDTATRTSPGGARDGGGYDDRSVAGSSAESAVCTAPGVTTAVAACATSLAVATATRALLPMDSAIDVSPLRRCAWCQA